MAEKAGGKFIRGSTELRLSAKGRKEMLALNKEIVKKGCFWKIYYSDQMRAAESAHLLVNDCTTVFERPQSGLESWHLGGYEGQPIEKAVPHIQDLVANRPWVVPPGMGDQSTKPGESFNAFKSRVLDAVRRIMDEWVVNPKKRIAVVTHFHDIQLIDAWLARYHGEPEPDDDQYSALTYNRDIGYPGEVIWLYRLGKKWHFDRLKTFEDHHFGPGIYFIRHGDTDWN